MTPFEALYGFKPPVLAAVVDQEPRNISVASYLQEREKAMHELRKQLLRAQDRMKAQADKGRSERRFEVGDLVYLKLQPYRQGSVEKRMNKKLSPRFFGPFRVLERIGTVAYKLELPKGSLVHPVFHVSLLKKKVGGGTVANPKLPADLGNPATITQPKAVLERRMVKKKNRAGVEWLIWWKGLGVEEATWEDAEEVKAQFPTFDPDA